jgi:micrococcal nuclease
MKNRLLVFLIIFLCFICSNVYASEKISVKLNKCIDGDTARFILNGKDIKVRFIGINTPEYSDDKKESFGKEASDYTCELLTNAKKIQVQYDPKSTEKDKYDRDLLWVFIDNELLQVKVIEKGLGKVAYVYGDYLYINELKEAENIAKGNNLCIWNEDEIQINEKDEDPISAFFEKILKFLSDLFKKITDLLENILNSMI